MEEINKTLRILRLTLINIYLQLDVCECNEGVRDSILTSNVVCVFRAVYVYMCLVSVHFFKS